MSKQLCTEAIPSILEKYSTDEFEYRLATEGDINEDYFVVLAQLTSVGNVDISEARKFYLQNLKDNPMFFMFVVCVLLDDLAQDQRR